MVYSAIHQIANDTAQISSSTDKLVYLQQQQLLNSLDVKCLGVYGMTSSEIEKEYYKYSEQILKLLNDICELKQCKYKLGNFDNLIGVFNKRFIIEKKIIIQENDSIINSEITKKIDELYNVLPFYNEWRSKINRMNIPTYAKYRCIYREFIYKGDFSKIAKAIMFDSLQNQKQWLREI